MWSLAIDSNRSESLLYNFACLEVASVFCFSKLCGPNRVRVWLGASYLITQPT